MQVRLRIKQDTLETVATCSLTGMLVTQVGPKNFADVKEVILEFEESSRSYCIAHNGPKEIIIADFTPRCFLEDILHWIENGISVKTLVIPMDK